MLYLSQLLLENYTILTHLLLEKKPYSNQNLIDIIIVWWQLITFCPRHY